MGIEAQSEAYAHQAGNLMGTGTDKDGVKRQLKLSTVVPGGQVPGHTLSLLVCGAAALCMWADEPGRLGASEAVPSRSRVRPHGHG